jgi:hypothetical protein
MLRVGAKTDPGADIMSRTDPLNRPAPGLYKGERQVELILHDDRYFG